MNETLKETLENIKLRQRLLLRRQKDLSQFIRKLQLEISALERKEKEGA